MRTIHDNSLRVMLYCRHTVRDHHVISVDFKNYSEAALLARNPCCLFATKLQHQRDTNVKQEMAGRIRSMRCKCTSSDKLYFIRGMTSGGRKPLKQKRLP